MRHRTTSLTPLFTLAVGTMVSLSVWAATDTNWIDDPDNRGTEAEPINICDTNKWLSAALPSVDYNLNFTAAGLTYITNTSTDKIATALRFGGGDFVVLGPMKFNSFGSSFSESAPVSIDKRGDWSANKEFYTATAADSSFHFTNRTGNLNFGNGGAIRIGNGNNSISSFVVEDGVVTSSGTGYNLSIGYGTGSTSHFVQNGGTVSIAKNLNIGYSGTGELTINNGTFFVAVQTSLGANGGNSSGKLNLYGGIFETPYICAPNSNTGGTLLFDGGTLKAAYNPDKTIIQGVARILVRIGERGGTIDTAGLTINWGKATHTLEGLTTDGGLAIVGGGVLNVTGGTNDKRFEYKGRTTIELGTRLVLGTTKVGGGVTFTIPAGLAPAVYTPLTTTGNSTLESIFNAAELPSDPDALFMLSPDKKRILCLYKLADVNPVWIGGVTGDLGIGTNWSTGIVPQSGNCYFSIGEASTLTSSASFHPDSITFLEGSQSVTINGTADISGVTVITNLSAVNHTINTPVRFANKIRVKQGAMAWASRTKPQIVFAGGAYGTSIDATYSRFVSGHYILSDETTAFVANQTQDVNRYGILAGSSLSVPYSTDLTHLLNGLGGDNVEDGGAFTTGVFRISGTSVCRYNQGRNAELVVTNELFMTLSSNDKYLAYRKADGWFKFEKVTIGASSKNYTFYFANSGNGSNGAYYYDKSVRIGAGGLNFEDGLANNPFYQFGRNSSDTVTITPWHSDFAIGTKGRSGKADVLFGCKTIFDTTDEGGIGRTITIHALCASNQAVNVTGKGVVVINNSANTCSGAVKVSGKATLALNAGCPFGTGAVTVTNATLKANSSGAVSFAGNVVCQANTALAFHFTEPRSAPHLAFNADVAGNTMPSAMTVRITAEEGFLPVLSQYTLTTGYDFTDTELTLVDPPQWIRSFGKDANGNIVIEAKTNGTVIRVR
ncbi:MAG: hypothetical protein IJR99_06025 [Kiritimatiellae bacterium]|nr:hypothetical protein [Kiritimatiellia bacterium]